VGGTPFLGISRPVVKAHGSSNARAFSNAIRQARDFAGSGFIAEVEKNIDYMQVGTAPGKPQKNP
jgi:glycerol-3-phosphate acyltransferase PlsX